MKLLKRISLLLCGLTMAAGASAAFNPTPDFWECANKVGGTFTHGRVPSGCDVASFGPDSFVRASYGTAIFDDRVNGTAERQRYMQQMYPIIRDAAARYLNLRKPGVQAAELAAFQRGVFALLRQESFWSHYRDATLGTSQPYLLKMVRGDSGHGHGMMQVDDRYHFLPLQEGKGWNMLQNFSYAIEIYYAAWQDAPAKCLGSYTVGSDDYWRARSRSAWSAYNGGPTKVCRWQNTADANVAKDNGYRDNFDNRLWLNDVADVNRAAEIDVACLMDNGSSCPQPSSGPLTPNTLMKLGSAACVLNNGKLECVDDVRDATCLATRVSFDDSSIRTVYAAEVTGLPRTDHSRHQLCRAGVPGLQSLGSAIATTGPLELRSSVDGMVTGMLPAGTYQVLDFEVHSVARMDRYYRVRGTVASGATLDGWINAGDKSNFASKANGAAPTGPGAIAYPGDWVQVNTTSNLNIRLFPATGIAFTSMQRGTLLQVKEVFAIGTTNALYYRVEFNGLEGWIFAGNLYPTSTLASWTIPAAAPAQAGKHALCPSGARYDIHSRQCLNATSVFGPFTAAATQACVANGAGAVCTALRGMVVEGTMLQAQMWSKAVAGAALGNGDCPLGTSRSTAHRFHCTEAVVRNGVSETDVFGPFSSTQVNACLAAHANAAFCRTNRWPGTVFKAQQP